MKKVLALMCVVCVVFSAGAAIAQPKQDRQFQQRYDYGCPGYYGGPCCYGRGWDFQPQQQPQRQPQPQQFKDRRGEMMNGPDMRRGFEDRRYTPDMPQEIRAKVTELAKLRIDLEEALSNQPMNKMKALDVHAQISKLEQEIKAWRFARMLERLEKDESQRDNKGRLTRMPPKMPDKQDAPQETPEPEQEN